MAERLILAMLAASKAGGDKRGGNVPAMTALLAVAVPEDSPETASQAIVISPQAEGVNPVKKLAETYYRNKGNLQSVHFPPMFNVFIIFLILPLTGGIITGIAGYIILKKQTLSIRILITLTAAPMCALLFYIILRLGADFIHYILPIYGLYQQIVIVTLAAVPVIITLLFIGLRALAAFLRFW